MENMIYEEESYKIIGAGMEVYNKLGCGFLENVYQECLGIEFKEKAVYYQEQKEIKIFYKGIELKQRYRADFICFDKILLEIKAVSKICDEHRSQILNYLNATGFKLGLILNFGSSRKLEYERFANTLKKYDKLANNADERG